MPVEEHFTEVDDLGHFGNFKSFRENPGKGLEDLADLAHLLPATLGSQLVLLLIKLKLELEADEDHAGG